MLYWAEGSKDRNTVRLTDSDADLLALFVRFLTECCAVSPERIRLSVNCRLNNGLELAEIETWWLKRLAVPIGSLRQPRLEWVAMASECPGYGTVSVRVDSTATVQSIYGAIQQYAGIGRPEWVDGRLTSAAPP
jgi:hypothetical protein